MRVNGTIEVSMLLGLQIVLICSLCMDNLMSIQMIGLRDVQKFVHPDGVKLQILINLVTNICLNLYGSRLQQLM